MSGYKEIDVAELQAMLGNGKLTLVDVRSDEEVAGGIIHGARHIPLQLLSAKTGELTGDEPLVFYCHSGIRSAQACALMGDKAHSDVFNLRGGILAWCNAGNLLVSKLTV